MESIEKMEDRIREIIKNANVDEEKIYKNFLIYGECKMTMDEIDKFYSEMNKKED